MRSSIVLKTVVLTVALGSTLLLGACGSGVDASSKPGSVNPSSLGSSITVTRAACTPFGAPPRTLQPGLDQVFNPTCSPNGRKLDRWQDADGTLRDACLYEPPAAATDHKLPLVIFLHPSLVGTDISLAASNVRAALATANLSGDPARPGFIMLAPYGRVTTRFYPFPDNASTPGWDNWYRQMLPDGQARTVNGTRFEANVDAAAIDHYLSVVLAQNKVDTQRIYIMGWSNGAAMATLYALNRPQIAAAAVYSAPDPFEAFNDPCVQAPVSGAPKNDTELQLLNPQVPIHHLHNACDIAGLCPNGLFLRDSLIGGGGTAIDDHIIDINQNEVSQCQAACGTDPLAYYGGLDDPAGYLANIPGYNVGLLNHLRWPGSRTDAMFSFLREHPHR